MKKFICLFLSLVFVLMFAGCGSSADKYGSASSVAESPSYAGSEGYYDYDYGYDNDYPGESADSVDTSTVTNRKLIYNADISAETKNFDDAKKNIDSLVNVYQGYIESADVSGNSYDSYSNRYLTYRVRIPATSLNQFLDELEEEVNVTSRSINMDDVTANYIDTEARLNALKQEEKKLMELLDKAETLTEILEIEDRVSEVRYQIESLTSIIKTYDDEIAYSAVSIRLRDVTEYTVNTSFGSRFGEAFREGWTDFAEFVEGVILFLTRALPFIIIIVIIVVVVIIVTKRSSKKKMAKFAPPAPVQPVPPENNIKQ